MSSITSQQKVILVTGANRGIGLAIIQSLATHPSTSSSVLIMGCRNPSDGHDAVASLKQSHTSLANTTIIPLEFDVTFDASIRAAVTHITSTHSRLDALINNAGYACKPSASDLSDIRPSFADTFSVNITSVYMVTTLMLPLLRAAPAPKVINVSSARGSLTRSTTGKLPPTAVVAYSVSKTALNALTVEMSKAEDNAGVEFQLACPGHCRTAFNGFRGTREPLEGAHVVVELVVGERRETKSWETVGDDRVLREVPW